MRLFFTAVLFAAAGSLSAQCFQKVIAGEQHFIAISQDGSLWGWGENSARQLGDGTITDRVQPVLISSGNWASVSAGVTHTMAIKADGTLWAWGSNTYGKLGNGTSSNAATPQQIGTAANWKEVAAGERGSIAIKTDGTLWAWGSNNNGYLGNNTASSYETDIPVQIGTETNWHHIAGNNGRHCLAIRTDGTLWAWGRNNQGQLGDGTTTDRYMPVQIGMATDWKWIDVNSQTSIALKNDNTLWAWGFANTGFSVNSSVPLQVGTDSDWKTASFKKYTAAQYMLLTKTNGSLWAWGNDNFQQLGNGTNGNYSSPTQIGTDTNWADAVAGYQQSSGIKTDGTFWVWGTTNLVGDGSAVALPTAYSCTVLGTPQNHKEIIALYPNPVTDRLFISGMDAVSVIVFDLNGRSYGLPFDRQVQSVEVSGLSAGLYIVSVETESGKVNGRFIKK